MKKIFYLFLFAPLFVYSQIENFSILNNQIQWQKVYELKLTKSEVIHLLKSSNKFAELTDNEDTIYGVTQNLKVDFKRFPDYPSIYVQHTTVISKFIIDFKENKYRVTVKDIVVHDPSQNNHILRDVNLERYGLKNKNTEFNNRFINTNAKFYDYTFFNLFHFDNEKQTQDW